MSRIVLVSFKRGLTSPSLAICSLPIKAYFHFIDLVLTKVLKFRLCLRKNAGIPTISNDGDKSK